jgi:hypothetical protein
LSLVCGGFKTGSAHFPLHPHVVMAGELPQPPQQQTDDDAAREAEQVGPE